MVLRISATQDKQTRAWSEWVGTVPKERSDGRTLVGNDKSLVGIRRCSKKKREASLLKINNGGECGSYGELVLAAERSVWDSQGEHRHIVRQVRVHTVQEAELKCEPAPKIWVCSWRRHERVGIRDRSLFLIIKNLVSEQIRLEHVVSIWWHSWRRPFFCDEWLPFTRLGWRTEELACGRPRLGKWCVGHRWKNECASSAPDEASVGRAPLGIASTLSGPLHDVLSVRTSAKNGTSPADMDRTVSSSFCLWRKSRMNVSVISSARHLNWTISCAS